MKLCFIVDYRSSIARNWISYFLGREHEIHVISTYVVATEPTGLASFHVIPVGFAGGVSGSVRRFVAVNSVADAQAGSKHSGVSRIGPAVHAAVRWLFPWVAPADAWRRKRQTRQIIARINPDVVHAMRIPAEGMLASFALQDVRTPLVVSVWGNDFTLFAGENPLIGWATRSAMERADALHTDCFRDQRLAAIWGFDATRPATVLPGSGGVQLELFRPKPAPAELYRRWELDPTKPVIFNPRTFRPMYVMTDVLFRSAADVLAARPGTQFVCVGMAGNPVAEQWRASLPNPESVRLLPPVTRSDMAELFQLADLSVSASIHDGTPNTLLEAMACGAYPVAGNIESVREWITDGVNGSLCDPSDQAALTRAMLRALDSPDARRSAAEHNRKLIEERADYAKVMPAAEAFYERVVAGNR